jgi:hypothetical protein
MKNILIVLMLVIGVIMAAGLAAAQVADSPDAVIAKLVDEGYWPDTKGAVTAESQFDVVSEGDGQSAMHLANSLGEDTHRDFVAGALIFSGGDASFDRCGFAVRMVDDDNYYLIAYNHQGKLTFTEKEDGQWHRSVIVEADALEDGSHGNELWAVAQGHVFEVFINGQHVGQFKDDTIPAGEVQLALSASGQLQATGCAFRTSWLWEAGGGTSGLFGGAPAEPTATPPPAEMPMLVDYDKPIGEAVAELERLNIIPSGGNEIFREPYAYFEGTGNWFTSLASSRPHTQLIMAGTLRYYRGAASEIETCTLMAHIVMSGGTASTYLQVGLASTGDLIAVDMVDGEGIMFEYVPVRADLTQSHHIMFLALRDKLTVYFDGEPLMQDLRIQEHAGTYGISLSGRGDNARCEGRDLWAWQVDDVVSFGDQCGVRAVNTVNLRSGPGTQYDKAGSLEAGQTALIIGQATASDGFVWWKLESGSWVRSDVVTAGGNCADVPVLEP